MSRVRESSKHARRLITKLPRKLLTITNNKHLKIKRYFLLEVSLSVRPY